MADISTVWNASLLRGDWVLEPATLTQTPVTANSPVPFAYGDGATAQFPLAPGSQISSIVAQIYRNDWQGNQLLYSTPRTNFVPNSKYNASTWTDPAGSGITFTPGIAAPDGSTDAVRCDFTTATGSSRIVRVSGINSLPPGTYSGSFWCRLVSGSPGTLGCDISDYAPTGEHAFTPTSSWQRVTGVPFVVGSTTNAVFDLINDTNLGFVIDLFGAQVEGGSQSAGYIPTSGAAVTVTDYTISPAGLVSLAAAPSAGAVLSWTGSYLRNVLQQGGFLQSGADVVTAVLISLFTDRVANADDKIPDGTTDPRGWWADDPQHPIGSRLWLLSREKQVDSVPQRAKDYCAEALKWMTDDGVVSKFDIAAAWVRDSLLGVQVTAYQPDGTVSEVKFSAAWNLSGVQFTVGDSPIQ